MASVKIAALAFCLMLFLGSALASEYAYGTKVLSIDSDFGKPLSFYALPNPGGSFSICYWETGVVNGFDNTDVVYLHQGPCNIVPTNQVLANDVRLTPFGNLLAGSKVTPQDNDIGMGPLFIVSSPIPNVGASSIGWINLYGGPTHDLNDPIYLSQGPAPIPLVGGTLTRTNDVRFTAIGGKEAGTKVGDLDPDLPLVFSPTVLLASPQPIAVTAGGGLLVPGGAGSRVRYIDVNGNGQYDYPDDVYLITGWPPLPGPIRAVSVNDLRLSGPV